MELYKKKKILEHPWLQPKNRSFVILIGWLFSQTKTTYCAIIGVPQMIFQPLARWSGLGFVLQIRRVMSDDSEFWCFHLMDAEYVTSPSFRVNSN